MQLSTCGILRDHPCLSHIHSRGTAPCTAGAIPLQIVYPKEVVSMATAKRYEDLTFTDDFMFCKILQNNPDVCKELTELILGRKIGLIADVRNQQAVTITADGHGVRFDVYFEDDRNTIFDIEMQQGSIEYLPRRSRYYQGMIDLNQLERGGAYKDLKNSYVVFISRNNPFNEIGLHKYSFRNMCAEKPDLEMGDGANKVFLCAEGNQDDVTGDLRAFLEYVAGKAPSAEIARKLDELVQKARQHKEWRLEYMTLLERDEQMREEGRKEGLEEGLKKGREEGREEERVNTKKEASRADAAEATVKALEDKIRQLELRLEERTQ